jgi:hypothetical protein
MRFVALLILIATSGCTGHVKEFEVSEGVLKIYEAVLKVDASGQTQGYFMLNPADGKRVDYGPSQIYGKSCLDNSCHEYHLTSVVEIDPNYIDPMRISFKVDPVVYHWDRETGVETIIEDFDGRTIKCLKIKVLPGDIKWAGASDWYCNVKIETAP